MYSFLILSNLVTPKENLNIFSSATSSSDSCLFLSDTVSKPYSMAALTTVLSIQPAVPDLRERYGTYWKKSIMHIMRYCSRCDIAHDTTASARISACLVDISSWMTAHQLKLNPSKTMLLVIPGDPSPAQDIALSLNNSMISPSATARNLGVTMNNQLSFSSHVTNVTPSCQFLLYNIRRIRPFLPTQATQVLVQSLVISRLDYCNSLLAGLPLNAIRPLKMIQNAAARLVFNLPKISHTTPLLCSLHWLVVAARIRFKTLMLAYKAKNGPAPSYLKALVTPHTAPRSLRSTSTARLVPPSLRVKDR
ncbi:hypothetical protein QTP70_003001 [Hemibagrus guttatus]|uniref:Reverse transcriptase n=1 Tax=Hemibagrus guttatus TaxID=175788 RepID=A0AAE0R3Q4_9TELE|nr:hypothetical protein QTP70_003001 [Hemibagrus guttatus]